MKKRRKASVVVIVDGMVLSISDGLDVTRWGFPGGGVDDGESYKEGARRELHEETGVTLDQDAYLEEVLTVVNRHEIWVVFVAIGGLTIPPVLKSDPFEGYVRFMPPSGLLDRRNPFQSVHIEVLGSLGMLQVKT